MPRLRIPDWPVVQLTPHARYPLHEATLLSLNIHPDCGWPSRYDPWYDEFDKRLNALVRATGFSLYNKVELAHYVAWVSKTGWKVPDELLALAPAEPKASTNVSGSAKAEHDCIVWLIDIMRASPAAAPMAKDEYAKTAKARFTGLSERGFIRAWAAAIKAAPALEWAAPGPRKARKSLKRLHK